MFGKQLGMPILRVGTLGDIKDIKLSSHDHIFKKKKKKT